MGPLMAESLDAVKHETKFVAHSIRPREQKPNMEEDS